MTAYEALRPEVRTIVDRNAAVIAAAYSITIDEAREIIAKNVKTTTPDTKHSAGH